MYALYLYYCLIRLTLTLKSIDNLFSISFFSIDLFWDFKILFVCNNKLENRTECNNISNKDTSLSIKLYNESFFFDK